MIDVLIYREAISNHLFIETNLAQRTFEAHLQISYIDIITNKEITPPTPYHVTIFEFKKVTRKKLTCQLVYLGYNAY